MAYIRDNAGRDKRHGARFDPLADSDDFPRIPSGLYAADAGICLGRAYLAFCSESERETIIRGLKSLRNAPAISPGRWEAIHNRLKQYREQGYATHSRSYSNEDPGKTSALAVPVYCRGHLVGTMSLTFFVVAMSMETAVETFSAALMEAAANLSSELDTDRFQISVD